MDNKVKSTFKNLEKENILKCYIDFPRILDVLEIKMSYHIGYGSRIRSLEDKNKELESKIEQLEKELCSECRKKFKQIFKEK